ncbi:hypothetical protein [Pelomicrobium methylotrophicum]|nr:hypothetical protein [Pelomicrobium methylotrophicum]
MDVADLRADGESADESDYATCQIGDNEKIRYVHISCSTAHRATRDA